MTLVNGYEIEIKPYYCNDIRYSIMNNANIEDKLNVVIVISNASSFASRYILTKEFIQRINNEEPDVNLFIVELAYGDQEFFITDSSDPKHLQLRTEIPLWHKENLINIGVKQLLPHDWKTLAWIDADLEFESVTWVQDTLKILNNNCDIVQLFSHAVDMDQNKLTMAVYNSGGYHSSKKNKYCGVPPNFWHPGYAWAITRNAYEKMGGLYDKAILGSGDSVMCLSLVKKGVQAVVEKSTKGYKDSINTFQSNVIDFKYGYVPGVIRHHYHGSKKNRQYVERWQILMKHEYDPFIHVIYNDKGILIPTPLCPKAMLDEIDAYFTGRQEDDGITSTEEKAESPFRHSPMDYITPTITPTIKPTIIPTIIPTITLSEGDNAFSPRPFTPLNITFENYIPIITPLNKTFENYIPIITPTNKTFENYIPIEEKAESPFRHSPMERPSVTGATTPVTGNLRFQYSGVPSDYITPTNKTFENYIPTSYEKYAPITETSNTQVVTPVVVTPVVVTPVVVTPVVVTPVVVTPVVVTPVVTPVVVTPVVTPVVVTPVVVTPVVVTPVVVTPVVVTPVVTLVVVTPEVTPVVVTPVVVTPVLTPVVVTPLNERSKSMKTRMKNLLRFY